MQIEVSKKEFYIALEEHVHYDLMTGELLDLILKMIKWYSKFEDASFIELKKTIDRLYKNEMRNLQ